MTDPTKYVRKMYFDELNADVIKVYDGLAPTSATGIYAVIDTSFLVQPITKGCRVYRFTVNLDIYEEFPEYGSSVGVDNKADQILSIMFGTPTIAGGYTVTESILQSVQNTAFQNDRFAIWNKKITIVHVIS